MGWDRFPKTPWLYDARDLVPQGDPETAVFLHGSSIVGLHIRGVEGHVILGIREDAAGHPLTCAITCEIQIDTITRVPAQSNPRRVDDSPRDYGEQ